MNSTAQTLKQAKALISDPEHWTQAGYYAYTEDGDQTEVLDSNACKFCAVGSVGRVIRQDPDAAGVYVYEQDAVRLLNKQVSEIGIVSYNDRATTTHADMMALFDRAIAEAERD